MASRSRVEVEARLKGARKFQADAYASAHAVDEIGDAARRADQKIVGLNARVTLFRTTLGLIKPAALVTGLGLAAQGATALGAATVALTGALGPLSGLMVAYPGLGLAAAQGFGAWRLAMSGVTDAVGGLSEQMDPEKLVALSPAARDFARQLDAMKAPILGLQRSTQAGLFPDLADSLELVRPLVGDLRNEFRQTGGALGYVVQRFALLANAAGPDLQVLASRNAGYLRRMGEVVVELANALRHVLMAAGPFLRWLTRSAAAWADMVSHAAAAGRETGRIAAFFQRTRAVAKTLWNTLRDLGAAFLNIGSAAAPLGRDILSGLEAGAASLRRWSESAKGTRQLRDYFQQMRPAVFELGRLARDLVKTFIRLGNGGQLAGLLAQVRTQLLPALERVTASTTATFGPVFVDTLSQVADLLAAMSGSTGPLTLMVAGLGELAQALTWVMQNVPGASELTTILLATGAALKVMPLAATLSGFRRMTGAVKGAIAAYAALKVGVGAMRAVYIAQTGVTNASTLAVLRHAAAQKAATLATKLQAAAQTVLNFVMTANPIMLVVVALAALAAGFIWAYKNVEWFRNGVQAVWGWLKKNWSLLLPILLGPIGLAVAGIIKNWDRVQSAATAVYEWVRDRFQAIVSFIGGLPAKISRAATGMWDGLKRTLQSVISWIEAKLDWIVSKVESVTDALGDITGAVGGAAGGAAGLLGDAAGAVGGILPFSARGSVMRGVGAQSVVGDAGPELATITPRGVRVDPLPNAARFKSPTPANPGVDGALADFGESLSLTVHSHVHLDGREVYESVSRHAANKLARR